MKQFLFAFLLFTGFLVTNEIDNILFIGCCGNQHSRQFKESLKLTKQITKNNKFQIIYLGDMDYKNECDSQLNNVGLFNVSLNERAFSAIGNHDIEHNRECVEFSNNIHFLEDTLLSYGNFDLLFLNSNKHKFSNRLFQSIKRPYFLIIHHPPVNSEFHELSEFWKYNFNYFKNDKRLISIISAHEHILSFLFLENIKILISGSFSQPRASDKLTCRNVKYISNNPGFIMFQKCDNVLNVGCYTSSGYQSFFTTQFKFV